MTPTARTAGMLTQQVCDELVVYDQVHNIAHRLNASAAFVYQHCDGKMSVSELASLLHQELGIVRDESIVWHAIRQLSKASLLTEKRSEMPVAAKLGVVGAAALLIPLVESLVAPLPVAASSCL